MSIQSMMNSKTSLTKNGMADSLFSSLMPQTRNLIYKFALQQPEPITVRWYEHEDDQRTSVASTSVDKYPTALTETCKLIRNECGTILYATNQFQFDSRTDSLPKLDIVKRFLAIIGRSNSRAMRSITIEVGLYPSVTAHFLMHALQDLVQFSGVESHIKFNCRAIICPDRLAAHGVYYRLVLDCGDVVASFQRLALEKGAELRSQEVALVSPQHWQLLQELKDAHKMWVTLGETANTVQTAGNGDYEELCEAANGT
ncbi:hypothetical protein LTR56_012512 [Elasticomyces elasticus]|nr:hypothetical protein LTR56_012512 [Elasticomyces elasticus]KAK3666235.1 hypothetical protein LTR22_002899 [Elasticomyces elasticus]KAK4926832.1 hypothetical protein LTR49_006248 [Elasticomyces elasticus]KAK5763667.1 hypothetical protein LTS12_006224 [Elasticomyces elasticus]